MSFEAYNTAGTYTDNTNTQIFVGEPGVELSSNVDYGSVIINTIKSSVTISGLYQYVYTSEGSADSNQINMNGYYENYYGSDSLDAVIMYGTHDNAYSGSFGGAYYLYGSSDYFSGNSGTDDNVYMEGTDGTASGGSGNDKFTVYLTTANANSVNGGGGTNTLTLSDGVTDPNAITFDLARGTDTGLSGLTFSNIQNLDYSITNPGSSTRRTASTQFTLESGTNALDFSYSSGSNTVYNAGGGYTSVSGGSGVDTVVGGTNYTRLGTSGGTDTLYGGTGTNIMQPSNGTGGTDRFYGGSGTDYFFGGGGTGNEYMYGAGGTDYFQGGGGNSVLVEGTYSDEFHGTVGNDFIYGSSAASKVYGGSGSDSVYTGASNQYFYSGTGKEYLYEEANTMTSGRLDVVDNFQTQGAGGKGTFVFEPAADANSTTFVASNGGTYIVNPAVNMAGGTSDVFVPNVAPSIVKAQTYFNL